MELIATGFVRAFQLLASGDLRIWEVVLLSLRVSGTATAIALLLGLPAGVALAMARFPGRRLALSLIYTGMSLPPVVAGLLVSVLLWRSGPLGLLRLLYTPTAMVAAQVLIAFPVVAGLAAAGIGSLNPKLRWQLLGLGASPWQLLLTVMREARPALAAAAMAGFGAALSEVGASMMVGGNVAGHTRVLTTATVLEVSKGNYDLGFAYGTILLTLAYLVTLALTLLQPRRWQV